jgi:hypothetical protein
LRVELTFDDGGGTRSRSYEKSDGPFEEGDFQTHDTIVPFECVHRRNDLLHHERSALRRRLIRIRQRRPDTKEHRIG